MEVLGSDKGSDFITNFEFVPPSPPPLDSVFEYPTFDIPPITPPLPHSPYNGSFHSPLSQHSELSFSGEDIHLQDFPPMNDYEPSDYDPPNQPASLLMFTNDSDYTSSHHESQSPSPHLISFDQQQQQQGQHQQQQQQNVPIINAPYEVDDMLNAPQVSIVPASRPRTHSDPWNPNFLSATSGLDKINVGNTGGGYDFSRQQLQAFTFGTASSTPNNTNGFLSPDSMRRSLSDASRHHRHSRSEDTRSAMPHSGAYHQQSHSIGSTTEASTTFLFPPIVDFHTGQQQQQQKMQNLHPSHVPDLLNSSPSPPAHHQQLHSLSVLSASASASNPNLPLSSSNHPPPGFGHFRRGSSGSRSDRGAEVWGSLGTQGHHGTPRRMSPYPSPNVSPRVVYTDLELDPDLSLGVGDNSALSGSGGAMGMGDMRDPPGFSEELAMSRRGSYTGLDAALSVGGGSQKAESVVSVGERSQSHQPRSNVPSPSRTDVLPSQIPKANVTTGRTANASHRRRKQDANFACTVPGCGSTFTRGFNLKGHLRSHFEEKPYKCQWAGCGKGFARQHDCKRHEQLHSNFRPFECDGCKKQFARMDALNRHLRSEAGVECVKVVDKGREPGGGEMGNMEGDAGGMAMGITGGMVKLAMGSEEQSLPVSKRRHSGGGGGGGADSWSAVAL